MRVLVQFYIENTNLEILTLQSFEFLFYHGSLNIQIHFVEMKGALQRNCMSTSHFAAATIVTTVL